MTFRCALITGATSGIGEALARLLAAKNIPLILTGRNQDKLASLSEKGETIADDLQTHTKVSAAIHSHAPDLLINCAGLTHYGHTHALQDPLSILDLNARASMELTLEAVQALLDRKKRGVILNVSSIAGELPTPGMAVYGAAKGCLTLFSQALDYELKPRGIRVLVACPGRVATPFASRAAGRPVKPYGITPQEAAQKIWWQIARRKSKYLFPLRDRWGVWLAKHLLPQEWVHKTIEKSILSRL